MSALDLGEFPLSSSRVPDAETQAKSFLTKHPEADGRGIVIAVMDTGSDPGAPGLQVTSHGLPKMIDCVDCTGSGDVDTSAVVELKDGVLQSPHTGRKLKLGTGEKWSNPSGKWHVGLKKAYELYDTELVDRLKNERRQVWNEIHRGYVSESRRKLSSFDEATAKPKGEALRERKDLEEQVNQLGSLAGGYDDPGVILDVVAWHDGSVWRAAVGGREDGDLSEAPPLANFAIERQWASLGEAEQMNYCLNVYDKGSVVSIVCDISSHGTHVAGIAAACHPDNPELNGVAPGAQIVSLKIGDTRLEAMETGTGLSRGFAYCVKHKIDLINMSFGEAGSPATKGRIIELAKRAVAQHGTIFVTSAGNSGPALSTVGAPANGSDVFITIGAHVSPPAMEAQYSMIEKVPAIPYTWTSRGPTQDGSIGVTCCAPGSAITSLPNWTLSCNQLMNGTSMASPNACGCLALILSALKAKDIPWSPASIRRAAQASALALPGADPFAVGAGMIQVDGCYEYLIAQAELPYRDVTIASSVVGRGRGVYLREPHDTHAPQTFPVRVEPCFKELDSSLNRAKIEFDLNIAITATASWVKVPPYVVVPYAGRGFNVSVDPSSLAEGEAHLAHVCGFDTERPAAGPLFRLPITVLKPVSPIICPVGQASAYLKRPGRSLHPGHIERTFVAVPAGCTWAEFTVTTKAFTGAGRLLVLHLLQDLPHLSYAKTDTEFVLRFPTAGVQKKTFRVEGNGTLEVTLAQFWNSLGNTEVDLEVTFHGVIPEVSTVSLSTGCPVACVFAATGPGAVQMKPSASLNIHRQTCRPTSSQIRPGGERDVYFEGKHVYELVLEYVFKMEDEGEVVPQAFLLNDKLYESVYESQLLMIFDPAKRLVAVRDAWPKGVKLKKGEHRVKIQVRHDDTSLLEKIKGIPLCIDKTMAKPVAVKAYPEFNSALTSKGAEFGAPSVKGGVRKAIFFSVAVDEKLPDAVKPGDTLLGSVTYGEPATTPAGKKSRGGFLVQYAVTAPKAEEKKEEVEDDDPRTNAEKLAHAVRDAQSKHLECLRKWATKDDHAKLLAELMDAHPKHLPLYQESFKALDEIKNPDEEKAKEEESQRLSKIVDAVDTVLGVVDVEALAVHLGRRIDKDDKEAVRKGKEMDKAKDVVVDALIRKIVALSKLTQGDESRRESVALTYKELCKWVDADEAKYARATAASEKAAGRLGLALAALNKSIGAEAAPRKEILEERAALLEELGWKAWADHERKGIILRFQKSNALF